MLAEDVKRAFGVAVRARREQALWSQEELADRCQLHRTYIGAVERGERNPSLVNVVRIAGGLGVDAADLMAEAIPRR